MFIFPPIFPPPPPPRDLPPHKRNRYMRAYKEAHDRRRDDMDRLSKDMDMQLAFVLTTVGFMVFGFACVAAWHSIEAFGIAVVVSAVIKAILGLVAFCGCFWLVWQRVFRLIHGDKD